MHTGNILPLPHDEVDCSKYPRKPSVSNISSRTCVVTDVASIRFVSSMANFNRFLPNLDRCDLPRDNTDRFDTAYPGCFLHGPEENSGLAGLGPGAAAAAKKRAVVDARVNNVIQMIVGQGS
jgi:hypothetical protein